MSHDIENKNGVDSFAFMGERSEIWHRLGQQMTVDSTREQWDVASGHNYEVVKVPAVAAFNGEEFSHFPDDRRFIQSDYFLLARRDNGHIFAPVTNSYKPVQPSQIDDWFDAYIAHDDRFRKDAAGTLGDGERIWTTARFDHDMTVAGDTIIPRLLGSTSYDATMATRCEATTTRAICKNTLRAAWADAKAVIKTTHRTTFDGARVRRELAQIVQSFDAFKAMGDAMAQVSVTEKETGKFLRDLLDIPMDAMRKDISTRTQNIVADLERDIRVTLHERNTNNPDLWCLLNGVTRYTDHDRSVRTDSGARDVGAARFDAATFGAGDALKGKAIGLLLPMLPDRDKVLIPV